MIRHCSNLCCRESLSHLFTLSPGSHKTKENQLWGDCMLWWTALILCDVISQGQWSSSALVSDNLAHYTNFQQCSVLPSQAVDNATLASVVFLDQIHYVLVDAPRLLRMHKVVKVWSVKGRAETTHIQEQATKQYQFWLAKSAACISFNMSVQSSKLVLYLLYKVCIQGTIFHRDSWIHCIDTALGLNVHVLKDKLGLLSEKQSNQSADYSCPINPLQLWSIYFLLLFAL